MRSDKTVLFPAVSQILRSVGARVRETRKLRRISMQKLATETDISRSTLYLIEKGSPAVSVALYLQIFYIVGFEKFLWELAGDEPLRRKFARDRFSCRGR